jgi:gluconolactonase
MSELTTVAEGLRFPEGPVAMPDGSVLVVEIAAGRLTRVRPDGTKEVVAEPGGGPNGAAIGPDGRCWICNNGGFRWREKDGLIFPGLAADDYAGGRIEAVDLETGEVEVVYTECDGVKLNGPNDLVFDGAGGFWFTDHGKLYKRWEDRGVLYYAKADGSEIRQAMFPMHSPNGVGLSPDDKTLYVAETPTGRVWAFDLGEPGEIVPHRGPIPWEKGRLLAGPEGYHLFDSLAIDSAGNVCVGDIPQGGITVIPPDGGKITNFPMPDAFTTNICFGGEGLKTAYITLSSTGKLVAMDWPRPGLALHHLNK